MEKRAVAAAGSATVPDVRWSDVGGQHAAKAAILETVQLPLQQPHLFSAGLRQRSGVLLYGPPGTGKTLLAKAVATECRLAFLSVKGPELVSSYVGESERQIRDVFERARDAAPCVIFFDEIDALAPNRGAASDSGGVMDRVVSQLLAELDGVQPSAQVFALAATNRPDLLDPSLLRPGRFDKLVYIGVAEDRAQQLQVLTALTRKFALAADVSLPALAERCSLRFSGADFYALCADALMRAIRDQAAALPAPSLVEASLGRDEDEDEDEDEDDGGAGAPEAPAPKVVVAARHFAQALETLTPSVSVEEAARYQRIQESFLQPERGGVQNGHS